MPNNWCFWTVVLEKTLESPLDCKEIKPVNPQGNQPWIFIERTDAEAEAPILWPPDARNWLIGEDPDVGKDWGQEEKGTTEDEMVGWYHWLNGCGFEQTLGDCEGWESLVWCSPWGGDEFDIVTEQQPFDYSSYQLKIVSHSFFSISLWPHGLYLRPWNSPGTHNVVKSHSFLQGMFPI